jgi:hypothetical protein
MVQDGLPLPHNLPARFGALAAEWEALKDVSGFLFVRGHGYAVREWWR